MKPRPTLFIGALMWIAAMWLVPGELIGALQRQKPTPRTGATLALFLVGAVLVLHGVPRKPDEPPAP